MSTAIAAPANSSITLIANKAVTFSDHVNGKHFSVKPGSQPTKAPIWVKETDAFSLAEKSGAVVEIEMKSPVPDPAKPGPSPDNLGMGFHPTQVPTLASLMSAGLTQEAAMAALDQMAGRAKAVTDAQAQFAPKAAAVVPAVATVESLMLAGATKDEAELIIEARASDAANATKNARAAAKTAVKAKSAPDAASAASVVEVPKAEGKPSETAEGEGLASGGK